MDLTAEERELLGQLYTRVDMVSFTCCTTRGGNTTYEVVAGENVSTPLGVTGLDYSSDWWPTLAIAMQKLLEKLEDTCRKQCD